MIHYALLAVIGVAVLFVVVLVLAVFVGRRRREACRALAARLGLSYAEHEHDYPTRYGFLKPVAKSRMARADNVLRGSYRGCNVKAFDFQCEMAGPRVSSARSNSTPRTFRYSVFILEHERSFPPVRIFRKGLLSKLGSLVSDRDVAVPNREFAAAFCVRSKDEEFARALCSDELMQFLLAHRRLALDFQQHCIAMSFRGRVRVGRIAEHLDELVEVRNRLPKALFQGPPASEPS